MRHEPPQYVTNGRNPDTNCTREEPLGGYEDATAAHALPTS
jgi:hypothetical protein